MNTSNEDFSFLKARVVVLEAALAYTINACSANLPGVKPSVINALRKDAEINRLNNQLISKTLEDLANMINQFEATSEE